MDRARSASAAILLAFSLPAEPARAQDAGEGPPTLEQVDARIAELGRLVREREEAQGELAATLAEPLAQRAELLKRRGALDRALEDLERVVAIQELVLGPDELPTALAYHDLGRLQRDRGELDLARDLIEHALAIAEDQLGPEHEEVAGILNNLALVLFMQGELEEARGMFERAIELRAQLFGPEDPELGGLLGNLGSLIQRSGDLRAARPILERALEAAERAHGPTHPDTGTQLNNLAMLLVQLGEFGAARPIIERALEFAQGFYGPVHPATATMLHNLASTMEFQGEYETARRHFERALEVRTEVLGPEHPDTLATIHNLGTLFLRSRQYEEALPLLEQALAFHEQRYGELHDRTAICLSNLSQVLGELGHHDESIALGERALAINEQLFGRGHWSSAQAMDSLACRLRAAGENERALELFERATTSREASLPAGHPALARGLNNHAELLWALGDAVGALGRIQRASAILNAAFGLQHPHAVTVRASLAILSLESGNAPVAWDAARQQLGDGHSWMLDELGAASGMRRFEVAATQRAHLDILLSCLHAFDDPGPHLDEAWRHITSWQGSVFRHASRVARHLAEAPADSELSGLRDELISLDQALSALVPRRAGSAPDPDPAHFKALSEERRVAQVELFALLGVEPESSAVSAPDLGRRLPPGSALVDFVVHRPLLPRGPTPEQRWGAPRVQAWIVRAGCEAPERIDLGPEADLYASVRAITAHRASGTRSAPTPGVPVTAAPPVAPRGPWLALERELDDISHLFLVCEGLLAQVPFGALQLEDGRRWLERMEVTYVQDPITLSELLDAAHPEQEQVPSLLALGDVEYGATRGWPPLPHTKLELRALAELHARLTDDPSQRTLLEGGAATEERFREEAPGRAILHLATHGFYEREGLDSAWVLARTRLEPATPRRNSIEAGVDPGLLAGLVFARDGAQDTANADDGILTAAEASSLDLRACRLAVLSACETALGSERSGEGLLSLRRALHEAGVRTVIASLWKVDDEATRALFASFYRAWLEDGASASQALRRARLELLADPRFADPHYWAGFTLSGEWR